MACPARGGPVLCAGHIDGKQQTNKERANAEKGRLVQKGALVGYTTNQERSKGSGRNACWAEKQSQLQGPGSPIIFRSMNNTQYKDCFIVLVLGIGHREAGSPFGHYYVSFIRSRV